MQVIASGDPASPILPRFFAGYDRAFVLPDEREELAGFAACLALNATHRHTYGRVHCEMVAVLEGEGGTLLGGANFLAVAHPREQAGPSSSIALNYVYVERAARGQGLLRILLAAVREIAGIALGLDRAKTSLALFIEQNDPMCLTSDEYAADTVHSGTDQVDRLAIWDSLGARVLDFPYVQPALSAMQKADHRLMYAAVGYPGAAIAPEFLHDHLESFFGISVLKGGAEPPPGVAAAQLVALAARSAPVALLPMTPALAWLRAERSRKGFGSFRSLARAAARDREI